jgi:hypothetical protein
MIVTANPLSYPYPDAQAKHYAFIAQFNNFNDKRKT